MDEWFINGFNQIQAYQKLYPNSSYKTADKNVRVIMAMPEIKAYIKEKQDKTKEYSELKHADILRELEGFAMLDITEIITVGEIEHEIIVKGKNGRAKVQKVKETGVIIKNFDELTDIQKRAIKAVKQTKDGIQITFFDKKEAFEMLNKHKGFYEKDNKQKAIPERVIIDKSNYKNKT